MQKCAYMNDNDLDKTSDNFAPTLTFNMPTIFLNYQKCYSVHILSCEWMDKCIYMKKYQQF